MWVFNDQLNVWQYLDERTGEVAFQLSQGEEPPAQKSQPDTSWIQSSRTPGAGDASSGASGSGSWGTQPTSSMYGAQGAPENFAGPQSDGPVRSDWQYAPSQGQRDAAGSQGGGGSVFDSLMQFDQSPIARILRNPQLGALELLMQHEAGIKGNTTQPGGRPGVIPPEEAAGMSPEELASINETIRRVQEGEGQGGTPSGPGNASALGSGTGAGVSSVAGSVGGSGGALGSAATGRPATAGTSDKDQAMSIIEGLGTGPASRALLKTDPASFVSLLIDEARGSNALDPAIQSFIVGKSQLLYDVADLMQMADTAYGQTSDVNDNLKEVVKSYVEPGAYSLINPQNVMRLIAEAKPVIEENANAKAMESAARGGNAASTYFDNVFDLVAGVIAPSLGQGARQMFSQARMVYERTKYYAAKAKGEFTGTPLDWMAYRSIINLANGAPGPNASKSQSAGSGSASGGSQAGLPDMANVNVYEDNGGA